jgi:hypothetical protein
MGLAIEDLQRICVKLYAPDPGVGDQAFIPIFHQWIRDRTIGNLVLFDVADYAHVPESPGVVLVTHEASFSLDRSDGLFGLLAQRRVNGSEGAADMIATTLQQVLQVAAKLEEDPRLGGKLEFDRSRIMVEANDRLRAPNTDEGYRALEPVVSTAIKAVFSDSTLRVTRVNNDPRDRLAADVSVEIAAAQAS